MFPVKISAEEISGTTIERGDSMFLRTLANIILAILVAYPVFHAFNWLEMKYIAPIVCLKTMYRAKIHIMQNGRGFYEHPVEVAIGSECFIRSMIFCAINVVVITLLAIFVPSGWSLWVIPGWAVKAGLILAFVINLFEDLICSFNNKMVIGTLQEIDEQGIAHFSGTWVPDFKINPKKFFDDKCPPEVGQKYLFMAYNDSVFCWARLETIITG